MTSLLPSSRTSRRPASGPGRNPRRLAARPTRDPGPPGRDDTDSHRPLALVATLGGAAAALVTLLVAFGFALVGWFLTDGGAHGSPSQALRTGALTWLTGHGSGVRIEGVPVTAVPLGVTVLCAWAVWRAGQRVGVAVSGHGPDSDEIQDGRRDLTAPVAAGLLACGYAVTAVLVSVLAATPETAPSSPRVLVWSLGLCLLMGAPAVAIGSGRAAIWVGSMPATVRAAAHVTRRVLLAWTLVALAAFVVALVADLGTAANVMSQLRPSVGVVLLLVGLSLLLLPNATVFAGCYLLGPGFTVGSGTLVTPGSVVLGPLPALPVLAALPDPGATPAWTPWLVALAPLVAVAAAVWSEHQRPTYRLDEAALRGLAGGVVAGLAFGALAALAGGAVGPGRLADVGPPVLEVAVHGVAAFGIGGLLGGLAMCWWQRRSVPSPGDEVVPTRA